jgi:hypothetical protein
MISGTKNFTEVQTGKTEYQHSHSVPLPQYALHVSFTHFPILGGTLLLSRYLQSRSDEHALRDLQTSPSKGSFTRYVLSGQLSLHLSLLNVPVFWFVEQPQNNNKKAANNINKNWLALGVIFFKNIQSSTAPLSAELTSCAYLLR